jgi:hypothetical protein
VYKSRPAGSAHAVTCELIGALGGINSVAEKLCKKPHVVQSWTDPAKAPGGVPLAFAARMTELSSSPLMANMLAAHAGGWFIAAAHAPGTMRELTANYARQSGELVNGLLSAGEDISSYSARQILFAVHEQQRTLMTLRAKLTEIARADSS